MFNFSNWLSKLSPSASRTSKRATRKTTKRLALERLEDRLTPAVHDLTSGLNYATIQAAVTAASANDVILADAGTYAEQVTINKALTLEGAQHGVDARTRSGSESIVTGVGNNGQTPFYVTASNVTIDGFTVQGATNSNQFGFGILVGAGTSGSHVLNNIVQNNIAGLSLANNSSINQTTIQHNVFRNNNQSGPGSGDGIYSDQSNAGGTLTNVLIDGNSFTGNSDAGIDFSSTDATKPATQITISNNVFDGNARGMLAFNLTNSSIASNTFQNSTDSATADIRLFEGVSGLAITGNLLENGAGRAVRIGNSGTGSPDATNVRFNLNSISGYTGPAGTFEVDNYTGTLDASCNWWGAISGPTVASNSGGLGQTITGLTSQVTYRTWLIYGTDADLTTPGFQLLTTINVTASGDVSAADNDYTRLANAIGCVQSGQTIVLSGTFDWTKPFAAAAWALGNDGVNGTADDYTIYGPANVNNVTLTAASLGAATIQGPGSIPGVYLEGPLQLNTGNNGDRLYGSSTNQNWTISNLNIFDFALGIAMFDNSPGNSAAFTGTHIVNNHIRLAPDVLDPVTPANTIQNIGIYYSHGKNQVIQNNTIDLQGNGVSDSVHSNFSAEVGMQGDTSGGDIYDGFQIKGNTVNVLHAQSSDPELIRGIWENTDGTTSNITVSNNKFLNLDAANNPALNKQIAFRLTSPSSATTTIAYANNQVAGAHVGFQYYPGYTNGGTPAVQLTGNTLTNVFNGFDFTNAQTVNYLSGNSVTGTGSAGTGIGVGVGSTLTTDGVTGTNTVTSFATGIDVSGTATLTQNTIAANGTGVHVEASGSLVSASQNFITNSTGDGIRVEAAAASVGPITNNDLSGNGVLALRNLSGSTINASTNWWGSKTLAGVQAASSGSVDYTPFLDAGTDAQPSTPGFQGDFSVLDVTAASPQTGGVGRIQEGVNAVTAGGTVNVLAGTYVENVTIAKNLTLAGAPGSPPGAILSPSSGTGITIGSPATDVTLKNLKVTGATSALSASGLTTLTLSDLALMGNGTGGTVSNVSTLNYVPSSGGTGTTVTLTGSTFQRGSDDTVGYSNVSTFNVTGSSGADTFNVTPPPSASTTFHIHGGDPKPPASPGDTLNVNLSGTTNPQLHTTQPVPADGYAGSWTFSNRQSIFFDQIETLGPSANLSVSQTASASPTEGGNVTFTITVTNNGPNTATNVILTDAVPAGTTFVSSSFPGYNSGTGQVNLGTITATAAFTGTIVVHLPEEGGISNTASVTSDLPEPDPSDNSQTLPLTVADAALTAGTLTLPSTTVGTALVNVVLLHFTDSDPNGTVTDYKGTVAWGDGVVEDSVANPTHVSVVAHAGGGFDVVGSHTYSKVGTVPFSVAVQDSGGAPAINAGGAVVVSVPSGVTHTPPGSISVDGVPGQNANQIQNRQTFALYPTTGPTPIQFSSPIAVNAEVGPDTADRGTAFAGLTPNERVVQALYLDILGRAGAKSELDGWAGLLNGSTAAQRSVASSIEGSSEGQTRLVKAWYVAYLGRPAAGGEEQGWVSLLQAGQTEEQVLSQILGTGEFFNRAQVLIPSGPGSGSASGRFVQALYQLLLDRPGSQSELDGWINQIPGIGWQGVALGLLGSTEFRSNQFEGYYDVLLHRPSDASGLNGWVFSNMDMRSVRLGFEAGSEFFVNG